MTVREVELGDFYQFWLAFIVRASASRPHLWYALAEPWSKLVQLDLLHISDTLPEVADDGRVALHRFNVTSKGAQLLQVMDPVMITDNAIRNKLWQMVADWMALVAPEYLPGYLSHGSDVVRKLALARAGFLEQHGWGNCDNS